MIILGLLLGAAGCAAEKTTYEKYDKASMNTKDKSAFVVEYNFEAKFGEGQTFEDHMTGNGQTDGKLFELHLFGSADPDKDTLSPRYNLYRENDWYYHDLIGYKYKQEHDKTNFYEFVVRHQYSEDMTQNITEELLEDGKMLISFSVKEDDMRQLLDSTENMYFDYDDKAQLKTEVQIVTYNVKVVKEKTLLNIIDAGSTTELEIIVEFSSDSNEKLKLPDDISDYMPMEE